MMLNIIKYNKLLKILFPKFVITKSEGITLFLEFSISVLLAVKLVSLIYLNNKFREDTVEALTDQTLLINNLKNKLLHNESLSPEYFEKSLKKLNDTLTEYVGLYIPTCKFGERGNVTIRTMDGNSDSVKNLGDYKISQGLKKLSGESCKYDRQVVERGVLNKLSLDESFQNYLEIGIGVLGFAILYLKIILFFFNKIFTQESKRRYKTTIPSEFRYM